MTQEEKDYCEICSIYDVCGYANRGLQRKCEKMQIFADGLTLLSIKQSFGCASLHPNN